MEKRILAIFFAGLMIMTVFNMLSVSSATSTVEEAVEDEYIIPRQFGELHVYVNNSKTKDPIEGAKVRVLCWLKEFPLPVIARGVTNSGGHCWVYIPKGYMIKDNLLYVKVSKLGYRTVTEEVFIEDMEFEKSVYFELTSSFPSHEMNPNSQNIS